MTENLNYLLGLNENVKIQQFMNLYIIVVLNLDVSQKIEDVNAEIIFIQMEKNLNIMFILTK